MKTRRPALACALLMAAATGPHAAPHQHGVVALNVALDGAALLIELNAPLDSLVGFERAPRNTNERAAADDALARLREPARLFAPDPAARCSAQAPQLGPSLLDPGAAASRDDHAELQATYRYTCADAKQLRTIGLPLFHSFRRIQRVDAQTVGPQGQRKATVRRANALLTLAP